MYFKPHHLLPPSSLAANIGIASNYFPLFLPPLLMVSFYRAEVILNCAQGPSLDDKPSLCPPCCSLTYGEEGMRLSKCNVQI